MFISRVEIPWPVVQNPYEIHRCLWRLFPGEARETRQHQQEPRAGFLFRLETYQTGRPVRVLVQSRQRPMPMTPIQVVGCREFDPQPRVGQRLAFILTANPIKTIVDAEATAKPNKRPNQRGQHKCRVPLVDEQHQQAWLMRHLAVAAIVETLTVLPHAPLYFRKGSQGGKLMMATFEGVMEVSEPAELVRLLESGVGPAKAFGCGLLLVRRT